MSGLLLQPWILASQIGTFVGQGSGKEIRYAELCQNVESVLQAASEWYNPVLRSIEIYWNVILTRQPRFVSWRPFRWNGVASLPLRALRILQIIWSCRLLALTCKSHAGFERRKRSPPPNTSETFRKGPHMVHICTSTRQRGGLVWYLA